MSSLPQSPSATSPPATIPAKTGASFWARLGPGLVTGAADDDPSGVATYSQAGAQFGFGMLWSLFLTYPLMGSIQLIAARIGRVSGHGLASNIGKHYPRWVLYGAVGALVVANTINIGADIAAMAEALRLLIGGSPQLYALVFGLGSAIAQVSVPYSRYSSWLKWLTMSLLAYVATVGVLNLPWREVLAATLAPPLQFSAEYLTTLVAVLGTTISPYLFFWQASQEVEELRADPAARPLKRALSQAKLHLTRIRLDTWLGMAFSNGVAMCVMLAAAVALHREGITSVETAAQAAAALEPVAGSYAVALFAAGIIGTGLLAIPVLAGSAGYAVAGALHWKNSLEAPSASAKPFYTIICSATLLGAAISLTPIDPIRALYWSAVLNAVVSVPIMVLMLLMSGRKEVMGPLVAGRTLRIGGWTATGAMGLAVVTMMTLMVLE